MIWHLRLVPGLGLLFLLVATFSYAQSEKKNAGAALSRDEIAKLAKPAIANVYTKGGSGSAFCIAADGTFVTNYHVVAEDGLGATVLLVLDAGLETQKTLKAKVIRCNHELDLALLKSEHDGRFAFVELGSDEKLAELAEVVSFGFPFGQSLAVKGKYPSITISAANISSIRRDSLGKLYRIQIDGNLNPGNSGGPVVDGTGKVVGVVVAGLRGAGINMAVPVSHVKEFLLNKNNVLPTITSYYPIQVGNQWTFRVTANGKEKSISTFIAKHEMIDNSVLARLESESTPIVEHLAQTEKGVFRHRFNGLEVTPPFKLIPYPAKVGTKWKGEFTVEKEKGKHTYEGEIVREEAIEVRAGKFKCLVVAIKLEGGDQQIDTMYWFAKDVGFVKQTFTVAGMTILLELENFERKK